MICKNDAFVEEKRIVRANVSFCDFRTRSAI